MRILQASGEEFDVESHLAGSTFGHPSALRWGVVTAAAILVILAGCRDPELSDGSFIDRGWRAATDRYLLDLGPLGPGRTPRVFELAGLPREEITLGLELRGMSPEAARELSRLHGVEVRFDLESGESETVFRHHALLEDWVWGCGVDGCGDAFAYLRGSENETPLAGGGVRKELVRGPVDDAWGSYFRAGPGTVYRLTVEWTSASGEPTGFREARIIGRGGGWK